MRRHANGLALGVKESDLHLGLGVFSARVGESNLGGDGPLAILRAHGLSEDAVRYDVEGRSLDEPSVAVNASAFIPPTLLSFGIHSHRHSIELIAVIHQWRDVDGERGVAAPVAMHDRAVHPNGAIGRDAVELQLQMLAAVGGINLEMPSIPSKATIAKSLGEIRSLVDRRLGCPIVRKIDFAPSGIVEGLCSRP